VRHDRVDDTGAVTLRYRQRLHYIGLGRRYRGRRVNISMADLDVRIITEDGELRHHSTLNPAKNYRPRKDDRSLGVRLSQKIRNITWCRRGDVHNLRLASSGLVRALEAIC
jgi:hypothetical protein